ncbi:MAG: hypothetical protein L3J32_11100 [Rhizobiaceae bacterium]|nr:hypothetical protein [Rhizobiaceae bacterium]
MPQKTEFSPSDADRICLLWHPEQIESVREQLEDRPRCVALPLTPMVFGELLTRGFDIHPELYPFNLVSEAQRKNLDKNTDKIYQLWSKKLRQLHENTENLSNLPIEELDHLLLWYLSSELHLLNRILNGVVFHFPKIKELIIPSGKATNINNWHYPQNLPLLAALDHKSQNLWKIKRVNVAFSNTPLSPIPQKNIFDPDANFTIRKKQKWVIFMPLGVPELPGRLRSLAQKKSTCVLLIIDEFFSGNLAEIYAIAAQLKNVKILTLFGADFEERQNRANMSLNKSDLLELSSRLIQLPSQRHLSEQLIKTQWPRHLALAELFEEVFEKISPSAVVCADHSSPEGVLLAHIASKRTIPVHILAHSGWPLENSNSLMPFNDNASYHGWTKDAGGEFEKRVKQRRGYKIRQRVLPIKSIFPIYLRPRHLPTLILRDRKTINVGIILTLEAFDNISEIISGLRELMKCTEIQGKPVRFVIRLRKNFDSEHMIMYLLNTSVEQRNLILGFSSEEPIIKFFLRCHLVVEAGTQSTAALEAFAALTPYLRLGNPIATHKRFNFPRGLVLQLNMNNPGQQLLSFANSRRQRLKLALKQHIWLLRQSAAGWFASIR